jgi:hypothetical protein
MYTRYWLKSWNRCEVIQMAKAIVKMPEESPENQPIGEQRMISCPKVLEAVVCRAPICKKQPAIGDW